MHSVWPRLTVTLLDSVKVLACFLVCTHCGCILFAVQYCCGWSCGTQTGALAVLCVLSSQMCTEHWGVTDHYPSGRWSVCVCVCAWGREKEIDREKGAGCYFTSHVLLTYLLQSCCQQPRLAPLPDWLKLVLHLTKKSHMSTFPWASKIRNIQAANTDMLPHPPDLTCALQSLFHRLFQLANRIAEPFLQHINFLSPLLLSK